MARVEAPAVIPEARPEPPRDRYGRYQIPDPTTGELKAWTRATTLAETLADKFGLQQWACRKTAVGISSRPDLLAAVSAIHDPDSEDGKKKLNKLVDAAQEQAGASMRATLGTALHSFAEAIDTGVEVRVPEQWQADLDAYRAEIKACGLTVSPNYVERICVVPSVGVAGTLDRLVKFQHGLPLIGDIKGLALTTPIPTPHGWTTMADVSVGDTVFDAHGKPATVIVKSPVKRIGTYTVRFDDGSEIVCDREHIWWTQAGWPKESEPSPKSVEQVHATLTMYGQKTHRVPVCSPLDLPDVELPIDPYLLGCWLGDGARRGNTITKTADLFEILEGDGHQLGIEQGNLRSPATISRTVLGLQTKLRGANLLFNKHIPTEYLRASIVQRVRLLQGLMDTDGTWNTARNRACFTSTDRALAEQVRELLLTLGQRALIHEVATHGYGKDVTAQLVEFTPVNLLPFRLPRKAKKVVVQKNPARALRRVIVAIEPGPDVPTACIGVDSSTHTYLCGESMIPTHNTGDGLYLATHAIQLALYAHGEYLWDVQSQRMHRMPAINQEVAVIFHMPAGSGSCKAIYVDIKAGWEMATVAMQVRDWRKRKDLATPMRPIAKKGKAA